MKNIKLTLLALLLMLTAAKAQTPTVKGSMTDILTAYLNLKNALVADNGSDAAAKAKILNSKVTGVPAESMTPAQQGTWKKYADKLSFDSRHISETTAIDHQREHFASLSKNVYEVVKAFGANTAPVYWQYCPMKKQSWLSDKTAIENPYYGKEMLDCGSVKETIKVAK
ncbi:MAG TPA: DUF3347 domain-containing protein [Mucilaginibacter sp.]|jgi:hypothetical protein|nr:DUF3347 domain-containing protein [Mucilaginibacter sp.]